MGILRIIGLVIFSILFLISIISFSLLNAVQLFLDANFYIKTFEKTNFYSEIKAQVITSMAYHGKEIPVPASKLKESLMKNIPDEFFKEEINKLVGNILAYLKEESNELNLKISFNKIKKNIEDAIVEAIEVEGEIERELVRGIVRKEMKEKDLDYSLDENGDIKNFLDVNKKYVKYINIAYFVSIVFSIVPGVLSWFFPRV